MRELLIVGAGGHAREFLWLASRQCVRYERIRLAVELGWDCPGELSGIKVEQLDAIANTLEGVCYVVAIGNSVARARIARRLDASGATAATLVDPSAQLSNRVTIGPGSVVCAGAVLTVDVRVGRHVHINSGCLVHHDVEVRDFATLSPGVRVAGYVEIGHHAFIGIGATIINGQAGAPLRIGAESIVAAAACVTRQVPDGAMVAGVPAVRKR